VLVLLFDPSPDGLWRISRFMRVVRYAVRRWRAVSVLGGTFPVLGDSTIPEEVGGRCGLFAFVGFLVGLVAIGKSSDKVDREAVA
jgi:hypothetical protein